LLRQAGGETCGGTGGAAVSERGRRIVVVVMRKKKTRCYSIFFKSLIKKIVMFWNMISTIKMFFLHIAHIHSINGINGEYYKCREFELIDSIVVDIELSRNNHISIPVIMIGRRLKCFNSRTDSQTRLGGPYLYFF
jgi:hypothetical protein